MRRIITLALLTLVASLGTAAADRGRDRDHRHPWPERDKQWERSRQGHDRGRVYPRHDRRVRRDYRFHDRRPIYARNNRFVFNGGYTIGYARPVVRYRYTNYRYRPQILVEDYTPVPGYVWVAGHWSWNGYEWLWISGHYQVDPNYAYSGYDDYPDYGYGDSTYYGNPTY